MKNVPNGNGFVNLRHNDIGLMVTHFEGGEPLGGFLLYYEALDSMIDTLIRIRDEKAGIFHQGEMARVVIPAAELPEYSEDQHIATFLNGRGVEVIEEGEQEGFFCVHYQEAKKHKHHYLDIRVGHLKKLDSSAAGMER